MGKVLELRGGQFAHGAEETVVAGANRERAEIVLQGPRIARLDKADRQRLAGPRQQDVRILLQIVQSDRGHRMLLSNVRISAGVPPDEAMPALAALRAPERFFGFVNDIAP